MMIFYGTLDYDIYLKALQSALFREIDNFLILVVKFSDLPFCVPSVLSSIHCQVQLLH